MIRKIILLIVFTNCYLTSTVTGQLFDYDRDSYLLKKLYYNNSTGEKGLTVFIHDRSGNLYKAIWELEDSSRNSLNMFRTADGKVLSKYRTFSDGITSLTRYEYAPSGLLKEEFFNRSDSVSGYASYHYNDQGQLTMIDCDRKNGWFTGIIYLNYNEKGQRNGGRIMRDGEQQGTLSFEYSDEGNLLKETWDFKGQWEQVFSYGYQKTNCPQWVCSNPLLNIPCGYRLKQEYYDYCGESGGPSGFSYDSGKLVEKTFTRTDGLKTITTYEYDENRKLIRSFRKYSTGMTAEFIYGYNMENQVTEKLFRRSDGLTGKESFAYDIHGKLRYARYDNMDSWLTGQINFTLDRYDRVTGGRFITDEGSVAVIEFSYDENDLVRKIHWVFTSGVSQTYTFDYEREGKVE